MLLEWVVLFTQKIQFRQSLNSMVFLWGIKYSTVCISEGKRTLLLGQEFCCWNFLAREWNTTGYWERYLQGSYLSFCALGTLGLVPCHCTELFLSTHMPWLCLWKHCRSTPWGRVNLRFNSLLIHEVDFPTLDRRHLTEQSIALECYQPGPWRRNMWRFSWIFPSLLCYFLDMVTVNNLAGVIPKVRSMSVQCSTRGSWQSFCFLTAETEKGSADHLDLAGLPPRPKEADSLQMAPPSPDSRKKARGIKKLFGR